MKLLDDIYIYPWLSYEANNCNTIFIDGTTPAIIDPGHARFFGHIATAMAKDGRNINTIRLAIATHSHPDHIEAMDAFDDTILKAIGLREFGSLRQDTEDLLLLGDSTPKTSFAFFLKEGAFNLGTKEFIVLETPGHTVGSICLYWKEKKLLISGDTVFYMGVGRTDLPGGSTDALVASIRMLSRLDIEYLVPGHGDIVAGKDAVEKNFKTILGELLR